MRGMCIREFRHKSGKPIVSLVLAVAQLPHCLIELKFNWTITLEMARQKGQLRPVVRKHGLLQAHECLDSALGSRETCSCSLAWSGLSFQPVNCLHEQ